MARVFLGPAVIAVLVLSALTADAAVLCARRRADGTPNGIIRVRAACHPKEVQLAADAVGFCCNATTTTTSTSTVPCPTTTTLGVPNCGAGPSCLGYCTGGRTCGDDGQGGCTCLGQASCGAPDNLCGAACGSGTSCLSVPVPAGCPSIGCSCQ